MLLGLDQDSNFVQLCARSGEVMSWKVHFKWKTVDCFVQETFAVKLTLFRSTNNTYALKQFSVVRSLKFSYVFRFSKLSTFYTIYFNHLFYAFIK